MMICQPLVSVVISVYNAGCYLRESVLSIVGQTYRHIEIIIIDDGSTDGCMNTISDIEDDRIRLIRQPNSGKAVALNRALKLAKGEFYVIQDADDLSYPERIEKLVAFMLENPEIAGVFSGYDIIFGDRKMAPRNRAKGPDECRLDIEQLLMPSHDPSVMFRLSKVRQFVYDPELRIGQGLDYILQVGEKCDLAVLGLCLYSYRYNFDSNTRTRNRESKRQKMVQRVFEKAQQRRDLATVHSRAVSNIIHRGVEYGLVAHFMESVLDLRRSGRFVKAIEVGVRAVCLHPTDLRYYKPLVYSLLPIRIINVYRHLTQKHLNGRKLTYV